MYRLTRHSVAILFAMAGSASLAAAAPPEANDKPASATVAAAPAGGGNIAETSSLQPFTHTAYIPAGADLSSIRFEGVKAVRVATKRTSITDTRYCDKGYQEPGGSMSCPDVRDEYPVPAYRITYSYSGPALGSDEYGNTHFTFSVNMRPEDLSAAVLKTVSGPRINRTGAAESFRFTTSRGLVQQTVIDEAASSLCEGNYRDGAWTRTDSHCADRVTYKTIEVPSDYVAVRVDPTSSLFTSRRTAN